MTEQKTMTITICMGSSCYSRGNGRNIEAIEDFIAQNGLDARVDLVGHLCNDACRVGPNIEVNGKAYQQVNAAAVVEILRETSKRED